MNPLKKISLTLFVTATILLAVIMGGMRLVISNIDLFESEISYLLEQEVSKAVVFKQVSGSMNQFNPVLRIDNVSITLPDRSQPLSIDFLEVEFDFWSSLRERTAVVYAISGELDRLELTRDQYGQWWLNEYRIDSDTAGDIELPGFSQVLALLPRYLKLDLRQLVVHDQLHQASHQVSRVAARIVHRNERFFSQVSAVLPDEFGRGLLLKTVVDSDSSLVYLNSSDLKLAPLARLFNVDTRGFKSGALDGELWLDMAGYRVTGMQGNMVLKRGVIQVADDKPALAVDYHARFNAQADADRWRVNSKVLRLSIEGASVPGFDAQIDLPIAAGDDRLAASINRLPLSSLPVIAGQWLPPEFSRQIQQGRLQGLLREMIFEIDLDQVETFRLGGQVVGLSNEAFGRFPGISKLDARLVMGHNKLFASLSGDSVSLDFGEHFRAPLQANSLSMNLLVNRLPSGNLLAVAEEIELRNGDVSAVGRLRLETDEQQAPFMYLRAAFKDAVASSSSKYIPIQLMPQETIDWLDRGIIGGYVPEGDLQFHGRLRDIRDLAREQAVAFYVDFPVENANIFFAPGWLHAKNGFGRVLFHNVGVEFDLQRASYENIDNIKASGGIADFNRAALKLAIATESSTRDALRVWRGTPVGQRFDAVLANLQDVSGDVDSQIEILLPLADDSSERVVNVSIDFKDTAARVPHWGLDLAQVTGRLDATEQTLEASGISARFFGDPVSIDVNSSNIEQNTEVAVTGRIASSSLLKRMPDYLSAPVKGESDWQLRLDIAGDAAPAEQAFLRIKASSDLHDTEVSIPAPFQKAAASKQLFTTEVEFYPQLIRFQSELGERVQGRGSLREGSDSDGFRLDELDIAFNSNLGVEQRSGINLYGRIERLSVTDWIDFLRSSGEEDPGLLNYVVLGVDRGQIFGRDFNSAVIELTRIDERLVGQVDSSVARGRFDAPLEPSAENPIILDLDYLNIDTSPEEADYSGLRPAGLPAFRLSSKALRYHEMSFNDLVIEARPRGESLQIRRFDMRRDELLLSSSGKWKYDSVEGNHKSDLDVTIKGPNLGEAIDGLGFGNSMSGGDFDFSGSFSWPAPLLAFSLDIVKAKAEMKISDGVMNNVEPGSGRFVGLLSLSALPRRLSLDFSDVVIDGMEFEELNGSYRIEDGVLYTEDTRLDGPAAKIKISGKTGIMDRDYDQHISVTPKIRQTLPILGALSAGSTVGWGLLLLQNLFKTVIDDAVEVEYRITGSWDDPQIELIKAVDENQQALPRIDK